MKQKEVSKFGMGESGNIACIQTTVCTLLVKITLLRYLSFILFHRSISSSISATAMHALLVVSLTLTTPDYPTPISHTQPFPPPPRCASYSAAPPFPDPTPSYACPAAY